jgi:hypothetical protein
VEIKLKQLKVRISDELHKAVKVKAIEGDISINEVVTQFLQQWINNEVKVVKEVKIKYKDVEVDVETGEVIRYI